MMMLAILFASSALLGIAGQPPEASTWDEPSWEKAGWQSRIILIDASSEVEIDLRAAR